MNDSKSQKQISVRTLFLIVSAFAVGFVSRNLATGLHPFAMQLVLPSSTTPVQTGDTLIVESITDPSINRKVVVLTDGTIKLPHVGSIDVRGQDVTTIEKTLTTSYSKAIRNPAIQVYRADASQPFGSSP